MAMPPGYRFAPRNEFLVGTLLRKRLRGEPLDGASASCVKEADVYGEDPTELTSRFSPTNCEPCEWFFFSWCKLKPTTVRGGGCKKRRKERTVRRVGRVDIGHWRSTQAAKKVTQVDGSGSAVTIGFHQNFEYHDSQGQKSKWLMEEYSILPSLEAAGDDDKELVICKIYKTPAARLAEAKQPVSSPASLVPPPVSPSRHNLPQQQQQQQQQHRPRPQSLQPPPSRPSLLAVVPPNGPNIPGPSRLLQASWSEQVLQHPFSSQLLVAPCQHNLLSPPLLQRHWPGQLPQLPPQLGMPHNLLSPPLLQQHWPGQLPQLPPQLGMPQDYNAMTAGAIAASSFPHDVVCPDGYQFVSDETLGSPNYHRGLIYFSAENLQPPPPPIVNPQPHAIWAAPVCDDRKPAVSQNSQRAAAKTTELHQVDKGSVLPPPDEQQQQQQQPPHAELNSAARACPKDLQLQERSQKRKKILGTHSSLFVTSPPRRPTIRKAPTTAQ